ncbi:MAG: Ig-like domain-containing protein, partial [Acidobacteria bacterium]|nr:Ig-like domain-containing protein [Acidobacteriota bacterium]
MPVYLLRQTTFAAVCVFAIVSLGSCDKVPLLAPTESVITLVSSRSVLPINGTAQIIATVIEQSGTPAHNGTLVTFTSTLGTLEPREALTSNGQAVVTLRAGTQSGVAEIFAFSGSARTETAVMVTIGGAATASISLTATPSTVPALGGTVTVVASVADASGNLLPGVPVSFSVNAGSLSATSVISDAN